MPRFEDLGELVHAARKRLDLSQEEFAAALGIKVSRLQKWESGVSEPRFTVPELRRLRKLNREVFEALMSGFVPLETPVLLQLLIPTPQGRRTDVTQRGEQKGS
jgi:transcriptional regulator with XRE-family HTH domain